MSTRTPSASLATKRASATSSVRVTPKQPRQEAGTSFQAFAQAQPEYEDAATRARLFAQANSI